MFGSFYKIFQSFTKKERGIFLTCSVLFVFSGILLINQGWRSATRPVPIETNLYREGIIGQPITINPVLAGNNEPDQDLAVLLFNDLLGLTDSHKVSQDGQSWIITLKPNLRWSDAKPLTSDDVIFTLDAIQDSETQSPSLRTWQGIIVNRISERELEFTLRTPYVFFLDNLSELRIIPKHIFEFIPSANLRLSEYNLEPVGSGPFQFQSLEKRKDGFITKYRLGSNPYFAGSKPLIQNLELIFYQDPISLLDDFNSKKIDGFGGLSPKHLSDLKLPHTVLEKFMPYSYSLFLNRDARPALKEKSVLDALNLATDKDKIIEKIFNGKAVKLSGPIPQFLEGYDEKSENLPEFSLEKAADLLSKNGWALSEKTGGVRSKNIGRTKETLDFTLVLPQIDFLTGTAEILKEDWGRIGVNLQIVALDPKDILQEVIRVRNYQMLLFGNALKTNSDLFSFWHSSQRFYPGSNLALYNSKKVDGLIENIRKTADAEDRKKDLSEAQKTISKDNPAIFFYSPLYLYVGPKDLGGFEAPVINSPSDRLRSINNWYTETKRVLK